MRSLRETLNDTSARHLSPAAPGPVPLQLRFRAAALPQKNFENLQQMQQGHAAARGTTDAMKHQLAQMKDKFFAGITMRPLRPDGSPGLTGQDGRPQVTKGGTPSEAGREEFEGGRRQRLAGPRTKDAFLSKEKQDVQKFLAQHQDNLTSPQVQAELTRMMLDTQKRAFGLQQQHEDERWKVDLPPSEEIAAAVEADLADLRQMEREQAAKEEQSPDMLALMQHEQDVAVLLGEQKQVAQRQRLEENFLMDPRKAMASASPPVDLGEVLPSYLSNSLYNMGIYTV